MLIMSDLIGNVIVAFIGAVPYILGAIVLIFLLILSFVYPPFFMVLAAIGIGAWIIK